MRRPDRVEIAWALVLFATGVALCFVPLFNLLGFEYAFVVGVPACFCGGVLGVRQARATPESPWRSWRDAGLRTSLLVALPLVPITLNALRVRNCDYLEGLALFLLLPGLTAWVASGWGVACGRLAPRRGTWLFVALVLTTVAVAVGRFWWQPPVDAFNAFLSYYPGALYDEVIVVDDRLLVSRLEDVVWAIAAVAFAGFRTRRPLALVALLAAVGASAWAQGSDIRRDADYVQRALGGQAETPRIILYHPDTWPRQKVRRLMTELEFAHAELVAFFGFTPTERVEVYAYPNADTKKRLMGARRVRIAKPWQRAFHVHSPRVGDAVSMHEMAHVFSADIADSPLHLPMHRGLLPHMALIEGLAVAATWDRGRLDAHQWSAAMQRIGKAPPLESLLAPTGFLGRNSRAAYTLCGSFSRYYRTVTGPESLAEAYRSGRFEDLQTHVKGWRAFLGKEPLAETTFAIAEARYDRPAIFQKVCAHEMAAIASEANRLTAAGDFEGALVEIDALLHYVPGDVYAQLRRARLLHRLERLEAAKAALTPIATLKSAGRVAQDRAKEHLGDLAARAGDMETARAMWREVRTRAFDRGAVRRLVVKLDALGRGDPGDATLELLTRAPAELDGLYARIATATDWPTGDYLVARYDARKLRYDAAVEKLRGALAAGLSDPSLTLEAERLIGSVRFQQGRFDEAAGAYEALAERDGLELERGERAGLRTWGRRARFFAGHGAR